MKKRLLLVCASSLVFANGVNAQVARDVLPIPAPAFDGVIATTVEQSRPSWPRPVTAPQGAPNVLLMMTDDVGFSTASTFGGPVPTPNLDRLAKVGQRYNRFHTTSICSPTRAALLTGRNPHASGMGALSDTPSGFPGYFGAIPRTTATIAQILRMNGYSTAMFGKHHGIPDAENSSGGPFDQWPTGLGFDYFFGFTGGDSDQWHPNLIRGTSLVDDSSGAHEVLDKRLADDAIGWIHNQKAAAPDRPFFVYYATGTLHAPHQAPPEWIARFAGQFTEGWDKMREQNHRRQLAMGIIPPGTKLTPRPAEIPAWDSLTADQKTYAVKSMQVAAAALAYQDDQMGRVLDELERMGELDKTLVMFIEGDNGASGEGGPNGTINEIGAMVNALGETPDWLAANADKLGGPHTYGNYPVGWAWALNTPFRWTKQYSSYLGGIRNGLVVAWPGHIKHRGGICAQFGHVVDIAPTILQAAGLPAPEQVNGIPQRPMDGQSLVPSLASCAPEAPRTQYFEMYGKIGLYKDGWFLASDNGRLPWQSVIAKSSQPDASKWELYDLNKDFSQSTDLAARYPERITALRKVWDEEARRNDVYPLSSRFGFAHVSGKAEPLRRERLSFDYWGKDTSIAFGVAPNFAGRSYTLSADINLDTPTASGAIVADGSSFGGWTLFLEKGRPVYVYALSTNPAHVTRFEGAAALPSGGSRIAIKFKSEGRAGSPGTLQMLVNDKEVATGRIPQTMLRTAGLGEMLDIGRDTGSPVTEYLVPGGRIEGDISHVALRFDN